MEENEALERKLPNVESADSETHQENISSVQMELPSAMSPMPAQVVQPVSLAPMQQFAAPVYQASSIATPAVAEDIDLIEKAWVEKAKAIVNSTHGDPFAQNKELNKVKAEYIKKRYDKDIKVIE